MSAKIRANRPTDDASEFHDSGGIGALGVLGILNPA